MSIRTIATLAIAVVLGLIAVIILNSTLGASKKTQQVAVQGGGAPVVVAAVPIPRGVTLQPMLLKTVYLPAAAVPSFGFQTVQQLTGGAGVQRLALRSFSPNEPILATEVSGPGGKLNLSSVLDAGMQAVSLRSNDVSDVGGFVLPGDRVDVLLTRQGKEPNPSVTQIIAENVRVLGIDQSDNDEADKPSVAKAVTIEVTPAQAQLIALGQTVGQVSLSLRHVADSQALAKRVTTEAELGFVAPNRPVLPARPVAAASAETGAKPGEVPLFGPGIVRVTRVTETSGYRLGDR